MTKKESSCGTFVLIFLIALLASMVVHVILVASPLGLNLWLSRWECTEFVHHTDFDVVLKYNVTVKTIWHDSCGNSGEFLSEIVSEKIDPSDLQDAYARQVSSSAQTDCPSGGGSYEIKEIVPNYKTISVCTKKQLVKNVFEVLE